jgi:hypothetical protein
MAGRLRRRSRRTSLATALLVLAIVLCLVVIYFIAVTPASDWHAPHAGPRNYQRVALAAVIEDLERHNVLPPGTEWPNAACRGALVTARWVWVRDVEALKIIGRSANVTFIYPIGHHGEIWAPVRVVPATGEGGAKPVGRGSLP